MTDNPMRPNPQEPPRDDRWETNARWSGEQHYERVPDNRWHQEEETLPIAPEPGTRRASMVPGAPIPDQRPLSSGRLPAGEAVRTGGPRPANKPAGVSQTKTGPKRPPAKHRWKRITLIVALAVIVLSGVLGIGGYFGLYAPARQLADDGAQHLQSAQSLLKQLVQHPLAQKTIMDARDEFSAAENDFDGVNSRLNVLSPFLGLIGFVSGRSDEIQSYVHLARMALDLSRAGHQALDTALFLIDRESNAFQAPGGSTASAGPGAAPDAADIGQPANGLTMGNIAQMQQTASSVIGLVDDAWNEVQSVDLNALPANPSIQAAVTLFRSNYPGLRQLLTNLQATFASAPALFGIDHTTTYLAELMDTSERRGSGGFITAYGLMGVENGQLGSFTLQDTYLLDTPYQATHATPIPANDAWFTVTKNWGLRDSNLEPDFPTDAKAAEQLYAAEGGGAVDGVIAFTSLFIQHILTYTGPIQIPELNLSVSSGNFVTVLHQYQLPRSKGDAVAQSELSSPNAQFPALLSKYLLAKLRQVNAATTLAILQAAVVGLSTKDVQLYVNNSQAEQTLLQADKAGAVQAPSGDALFVVDTNISANKANDNIDEVIQDNVVLDDQGNANHHLVIAFHWNRSEPVYGSSTYSDFVRIYVPATSQLLGDTGFTNFATSSAYQRTVWSGTFQLVFGQKILLTLTYVVPNAVQQQQGQSHYSLLVQRQASSPLPQLSLTISLPQTANLLQHSSDLVYPNNTLQFPQQPLDHDNTFTTDYD